MKPVIENLICMGDERIAPVFVSLLNAITWATDEDALRNGIKRLEETEPLFGTFFAYGFGKHHCWVHQRKFSDNRKVFVYRLLIVEF